jgi:hypothetical protein
MSSATRFPVRFTGVNRALAVLGMTSRNSFVDVTGDSVEVRMGWAFRVRFERSAITSAVLDHDRVLGWGVHGWRGKWLVNGSSSGLVRIELDPEARAKVLGVTVRLAVLRVSVVNPDGLVEALGR